MHDLFFMPMPLGARSVCIVCAATLRLRFGTKKNATLFCARDHFGIKPFYYAMYEDLFLFSNTLEALLAHPRTSGELNESAVGDFLLFGLNCDNATTTFRDVQRLPPGHALMVSRKEMQLRVTGMCLVMGASGTLARENMSNIFGPCLMPPWTNGSMLSILVFVKRRAGLCSSLRLPANRCARKRGGARKSALIP